MVQVAFLFSRFDFVEKILSFSVFSTNHSHDDLPVFSMQYRPESSVPILLVVSVRLFTTFFVFNNSRLSIRAYWHFNVRKCEEMVLI